MTVKYSHILSLSRSSNDSSMICSTPMRSPTKMILIGTVRYRGGKMQNGGTGPMLAPLVAPQAVRLVSEYQQIAILKGYLYSTLYSVAEQTFFMAKNRTIKKLFTLKPV